MNKPILCCSFSSGETSAFMTWWCHKYLSSKYDIITTFANTGEENEKSLIFADKCDKYFGWNTIWLEAVTNPEYGKGVEHKIVDFESASRHGEPFEGMIAKHGIPNVNFPHCSRELKGRVIKHYLKTIGAIEAKIAIGIRHDEKHRINWDVAQKENLFYPLTTLYRCDKPTVNRFWRDMPFRLALKSYEGNCKWCWKKSKRKRLTLAVETPEVFEFPRRMEIKYGDYVPPTRKSEVKTPIHFFRDNESVEDLFEDAKFPFRKATDEKLNYQKQFELWEEELDSNFGCTESCEAFGDLDIEEEAQ